MKTQTALLLLGVVALSSASGYGNPPAIRKLQAIPVPKNYQHAATAPPPPAASYDDAVRDEVEPVVYKAPTRIIERAPIRVASASYGSPAATLVRDQDEEPRQHSRGGYVHKEEKDDGLELEYAKNAQYSFASAIDDGIHDQSQIRQESRDGLKVTGTYAYSDGFFKRTVNYEADENGYRVVGETVEPISEQGPQVDLVNGRAEVHTQIGGVDTQYSVSADELALLTRKAMKKED